MEKIKSSDCFSIHQKETGKWQMKCQMILDTDSFFNPLNPKIKIWILICCPYSFPTEVVGRSW